MVRPEVQMQGHKYTIWGPCSILCLAALLGHQQDNPVPLVLTLDKLKGLAWVLRTY